MWSCGPPRSGGGAGGAQTAAGNNELIEEEEAVSELGHRASVATASRCKRALADTEATTVQILCLHDEGGRWWCHSPTNRDGMRIVGVRVSRARWRGRIGSKKGELASAMH
jgi:hypothetical protein